MIPKSALATLQDLQQWITERENLEASLKPAAQAQIVWADPDNIVQTEYSLLYLHGFKATHAEGFPTHKRLAKKLGCNLFLSRLSKHGLNDADAFKNLQSKELVSSAVEAFEIANRLGKKTIIAGTSTGASLALYLAAQTPFKDDIAALLLYSPLVKFYGLQNIFLASKAGRLCIRFCTPKNYKITSRNNSEQEEQIWYSSYHINGVLALGKFVQHYMTTQTFEAVNCPVFTAYYRKNMWQHDKVVSVRALKNMHQSLGTANAKKKLLNLPKAQTHVISSGLLSKSTNKLVDESFNFLQNQLRLD